VFNGFRLNGAPFNGFLGGAFFNSNDREPDFRWLVVRAQQFAVFVRPENDRLAVKADNVSIKVRNDR